MAMATPTMLTVLLLTLLLLPLQCQSIYLDIHIPLPDGCLKYHALLANRLLRHGSADESGGAADILPTEQVNLFSSHTPHISLYLADFALEVSNLSINNNGSIPILLNDTKVSAFLNEISSINLTEIITRMECTLAFYSKNPSNTFYIINGDYTMLPIANTPCLQTLSDTILFAMKSYLRQPVVVPNWVADLPEPSRSASIYRSREYGSPNVLEGFDPHVTVGFDTPTILLTPSQQVRSAMQLILGSGGNSLDNHSNNQANNLQWRIDAMNQWNDIYQQAVTSESCVNQVSRIALGKVGVGGTVLANSRMGYWDIPPGDRI
jgi:hypothetical protein